LAPRLAERLEWLAPTAERVRLYSTVTGRAVSGASLGPDYWAQNLAAPVRFSDAVAAAAADGVSAFLEIGPASLGVSLRESAGRNGPKVTVLSSMRGGRPEPEAIREALAAL